MRLSGQFERPIWLTTAATALPHSSFLRFPGDSLNRIIGLPGFVGEGIDTAGMKWISSFPGNVSQGMARASAVMILNSCATGRAEAILEASLISAQRTAASAALGAQVLTSETRPSRVGLVGTGVINREVARYLLALLPEIDSFVLFDLSQERAAECQAALQERFLGPRIEVAASLEEMLESCPLVSFATTAIQPYLADLSVCPPGACLLHLSLRDMTPEVILTSNNVVDDPDHACRAETSVHLAETKTGSRDFIWCTLAELLLGEAPTKPLREAPIVVSPFGLGVLDLAVAQWVLERARASNLGVTVANFFPS